MGGAADYLILNLRQAPSVTWEPAHTTSLCRSECGRDSKAVLSDIQCLGNDSTQSPNSTWLIGDGMGKLLQCGEVLGLHEVLEVALGNAGQGLDSLLTDDARRRLIDWRTSPLGKIDAEFLT